MHTLWGASRQKSARRRCCWRLLAEQCALYSRRPHLHAGWLRRWWYAWLPLHWRLHECRLLAHEHVLYITRLRSSLWRRRCSTLDEHRWAIRRDSSRRHQRCGLRLGGDDHVFQAWQCWLIYLTHQLVGLGGEHARYLRLAELVKERLRGSLVSSTCRQLQHPQQWRLEYHGNLRSNCRTHQPELVTLRGRPPNHLLVDRSLT
mmetsp:Transcript_25422/g.58535  ORF Transcript_25422/g.58535 Transcript_25422/m.58535 type:complete len:203 (-) Transcript_25422:1449-2057(-)